MIEAAQTAIDFVADRQRADLDSDKMLRLALVRAIEVIGEAAGRVSKATQGAAPDIPWSLIVSMRNRLIHAYFDINLDILWQTATIELHELLPRLEALIEAE
jgi:uncharacterized protein with HEPN domain